jgi:prefoldin alpha subunit
MGENEDRQGKIIMYQILQAEYEELRRQMLLAESRVIDLETSDHALNEMKRFRKDNETLVPLGSGCYAKGSIMGSDLLLDIGAGIMIERNVNSVKEFLDERKSEIEKARKEIQLQMESVIKTINELTPEIEKIIRESQQG